jgi:hypothetical protein
MDVRTASRVWSKEAASGVTGLDLTELDIRGAVVYHVHDGRLTKIVGYFDRNRAFADLGLAPEGEGSTNRRKWVSRTAT